MRSHQFLSEVSFHIESENDIAHPCMILIQGSVSAEVRFDTQEK